MMIRRSLKFQRRALVIVLPCYGALEIVGVIIILLYQFAPCKNAVLWCVKTQKRKNKIRSVL